MCKAAESMKRSYVANDPEKASDEAHTIHNPVVKGQPEGAWNSVTPPCCCTNAAAFAGIEAGETTPEPVVKTCCGR